MSSKTKLAPAGHVVQKRAFEGVADGFLCASLSRGASRSHDGASAVAHHRVDVVHVHVDFPGQRDDFRNAFGCSAEDLVCVGEGAADGLVAKISRNLSLRMMSRVFTAARMASRPSEACWFGGDLQT